MSYTTIVVGPPPEPPRGPGCMGSKFAVYFILAAVIAICFVAGFNPFKDMGTASEAKPDRGAAQAEILKVARGFDDLGYQWGGGHNPKQWVAGYRAGKNVGGLDCSGLVDVSVYIVTDGKINSWQVAEGFHHDKNWKTLGTGSDLNAAQPGDIVWRKPGYRGNKIGHVGIVMENDVKDKEVKIFEAKSSQLPHDQQIRVSTYPYHDFQGASRLKFQG